MSLLHQAVAAFGLSAVLVLAYRLLQRSAAAPRPTPRAPSDRCGKLTDTDAATQIPLGPVLLTSAAALAFCLLSLSSALL